MSKRHDETLSPADRAKLGAHYTPMAWARRIVERAIQPLLSWPNGVSCRACHPTSLLLDLLIVDPACGDGVFLDAAADVLGALVFLAHQSERRDVSLAESRAQVVRSCLIGVDKDPGAIAAAREKLGPDAELRCEDALTDWFLDTAGRPAAFVGNPPYLGGGKISGTLGVAYQKRLLKDFPHSNGGADFSSYFLMAAAAMLIEGKGKGTIGMVFTNTISQGATREAGLGPLLQQHGFSIYAADRDVRWPGAAKVSCSIVHLANKALAWALWPGEMIERAAEFPWAWMDDPAPLERTVYLEKRAPRAAQGVLFG